MPLPPAYKKYLLSKRSQRQAASRGEPWALKLDQTIINRDAARADSVFDAERRVASLRNAISFLQNKGIEGAIITTAVSLLSPELTKGISHETLLQEATNIYKNMR